jgi:hypothetical protein
MAGQMKKRAARYQADNHEAARIILADSEKYGGCRLSGRASGGARTWPELKHASCWRGPGRPPWSDGPGVFDRAASGEELREAVSGFTAYFGTFDVNESTQTVIHHVQACLVPGWVGTDLKRTYRFNANRLVLTAATTTSVLELIWERERD